MKISELTCEDTIDYEKACAEIGNRQIGKQRGFWCEQCNNRGFSWYFEVIGGHIYRMTRRCECMKRRCNIDVAEQSGLGDLFNRYTFEKFDDTSEWQKQLKSKAMEYAEKRSGWFFVGGQSGSGKSHLCVAIAAEFIRSGRKVKYMSWKEDCAKLKGGSTYMSDYEKQIKLFKEADVLYIDDFLYSKDSQSLSNADIGIGFEIINYRYGQKDKPTIISSEKSIKEILSLQQGLGSRIYQKSNGYCLTIEADANKNYRLRKEEKN